MAVNLTKKRREMYARLAKDPGGFGNGHAFYMVSGLSDISDFIAYIYRKDKAEYYCVCLLTMDDKKGVVCFHTHEKGKSSFQSDISFAYPDAVVYWNDCWYDEANLVVMKNGVMIDSSDVCRITLGCDVVADEGCFDDDDPYYECTATVTDNLSGESFDIGGGCIAEDQRNAIITLAAKTA